MSDRQRSCSKIGTFVLLTATPSWAKAGNAASDPTVIKRSNRLWGVIMMRCRLLRGDCRYQSGHQRDWTPGDR